MREYAVIFCIVTGGIFQLLAAVGILKFPKVLIRLHASSKASALGFGLMLLGAALYHWQWDITVKCILAIFFLSLTSPAVAHVLAKLELD